MLYNSDVLLNLKINILKENKGYRCVGGKPISSFDALWFQVVGI